MVQVLTTEAEAGGKDYTPQHVNRFQSNMAKIRRLEAMARDRKNTALTEDFEDGMPESDEDEPAKNMGSSFGSGSDTTSTSTSTSTSTRT